ncbi:MAG: PKD domain-containing protein [Vicinamibacterales bacterium]
MHISRHHLAVGVVIVLAACGGSPNGPAVVEPPVVTPPPPAAPVARAAAPLSDPASSPIVFRGEQSTGQISTYRWNFGDGSAEQAGADKVQVTYTYGCRARVGTEAERTFAYSLTVTDTLGRSHTANGSILIRYVYDGVNYCAT